MNTQLKNNVTLQHQKKDFSFPLSIKAANTARSGYWNLR